jgi:hypothetical protein
MYGHHVYEHGAGRFGVMLMFDSARKWSNAKKTLIAGGFAIRQNGDTEGTALFDPEDKAPHDSPSRSRGHESVVSSRRKNARLWLNASKPPESRGPHSREQTFPSGLLRTY